MLQLLTIIWSVTTYIDLRGQDNVIIDIARWIKPDHNQWHVFLKPYKIIKKSPEPRKFHTHILAQVGSDVIGCTDRSRL